MPILPTDRPLPLEMNEPDAERVSNYIGKLCHESEPNERLLIEILDALRRIDDKLGRLLTKGADV